VAVEGLNSGENLAVVPEGDQDLGIGFDCFGEKRERPHIEGFFLWWFFVCFGHLKKKK
jgi:hypothetical protein